MKSQKIRCRKVRRILRYHEPNKVLQLEKYAHHFLVLFYPPRDEQELLLGYPPLYQNKPLEPGVQNVVKSNKIKFKPYGDSADKGKS